MHENGVIQSYRRGVPGVLPNCFVELRIFIPSLCVHFGACVERSNLCRCVRLCSPLACVCELARLCVCCVRHWLFSVRELCNPPLRVWVLLSFMVSFCCECECVCRCGSLIFGHFLLFSDQCTCIFFRSESGCKCIIQGHSRERISLWLAQLHV